MHNGLMMDAPLTLIDVLEYAAQVHPKAEVVSATVEGGIHRQTYRQTRRRVAQLAHALVALGVKPGDRVATIAWNGYRHLELYYAIAAIGAVCHTINPRLPADQMAYIVNHADDSLMFFDTTFTPLITGLRDQFPAHTRYVAMTDRQHMPEGDDLLCYEEQLDGQPETYDWPELDENTACALCYTSGTTGNPKGALYSHRSCLLQALFTMAGSNGVFRVGDRLLPVVPMFHVNAWGLPYAAPLTGCSLIMPGAALDGASLFELMDQEDVTGAWGVPTVWMGLLAEMKQRGRKPGDLRQILIGGSAPPRSMLRAFEQDYGIQAMQGWGMTEMNPTGSMGVLVEGEDQLPLEQRLDIKSSAGRRLFGVRMKLVGDDGQEVAQDGEAVGELYVKGPTVISAYFNNEEATAKAFDKDGWFATGDMASLTEDGVLHIVDRAKDLIKSGGEWISSIDLENLAAAHPDVAECAVIGVPHPKWDERPLLIVVPRPGSQPDKQALLDHMATEIAKWQLPDDVLFVDELPHTATGKVSKRHLRDRFGGHLADAG
ncbi:long-chain fatty acid--CoA ligase [Alloalcanivorax gelatiniphagus]|uniref:Long-chain fatty acid--CoA ligase n=1 Tax=Alloalcanivorax gelatiniphagus TaxID=1194167 RepID=A0ABY2XN39_9GAMM|nr:long-chain fatty acid--CoA ligase [Alloalcanivorax gelatiniphagus]TMW12834.1 long-chain fatty acid--CoA ligase [Alloalcanivorax gelatiniphagus]|tara:strand:+ start:22095 stop:23726 length:1632 start_codon:yes stop_codon:yes gene_type:complete